MQGGHPSTSLNIFVLTQLLFQCYKNLGGPGAGDEPNQRCIEWPRSEVQMDSKVKYLQNVIIPTDAPLGHYHNLHSLYILIPSTIKVHLDNKNASHILLHDQFGLRPVKM